MIPQHENDLKIITPKPLNAYEDLSLAALTVYSLYWLKQWGLRRTIEATTVLNWRLFPSKFAMVGFDEYPDAFRTNRSLLQGQPKYRNWLTGSATKGFTLNSRGMELAEELTQRLGPPSDEAGAQLGPKPEVRSQPKQARTIEPERETAKIRASRLFQRWREGTMSDRDLIHVHSMLNIFDHTPRKIREQRFRDMQRAAADAPDDEVATFLRTVRDTFTGVFTSSR